MYHVHVGSTAYREGEIIIRGILVRQRKVSVEADTSMKYINLEEILIFQGKVLQIWKFIRSMKGRQYKIS